MIAFERSRHNDEIGVADDRRCRGFEHAGFYDFLAKGLKTGLHDVDLALIGHIDDLLVDVDACDVHAVFCGDDGGRKPDIPIRQAILSQQAV